MSDKRSVLLRLVRSLAEESRWSVETLADRCHIDAERARRLLEEDPKRSLLDVEAALNALAPGLLEFVAGWGGARVKAERRARRKATTGA